MPAVPMDAWVTRCDAKAVSWIRNREVCCSSKKTLSYLFQISFYLWSTVWLVVAVLQICIALRRVSAWLFCFNACFRTRLRQTGVTFPTPQIFPRACGIAGCLDECSDLSEKQNSAKGGRILILIIKYHCGISLLNGSHLSSMETNEVVRGVCEAAWRCSCYVTTWVFCCTTSSSPLEPCTPQFQLWMRLVMQWWAQTGASERTGKT